MKDEKIIIYQVLTRLFDNNNNTNKKNGSIVENGVGKFNSFTDKALKEIQKLGITHIWYTGVLNHASRTNYTKHKIKRNHPSLVKGNAGSPYAIKDYYDVCPDLAEDVNNRMKEFEELIERTHQHHLKAIIDFVPNHVAREYYSSCRPKGIKDLGERDNKNKHFDVNNNFYYLTEDTFEGNFDLYAGEKKRYQEKPAKVTGNDCFHHSPSTFDWFETIKLNYGVDYLNHKKQFFDPIPDTWHKMKDILLFWASKGVDGFRCDMAEMVPVEFWDWAISKVKEKYPHIIFIAEVYNPHLYKDYLFKGKFDFLYDKVGLYDTLKDILLEHKPASAITHCWQAIDGFQNKMLNFLENHDEQRIASDFFIKDGFAAIPALITSACISSSPFMIYFAQELEEKGMDEEGFSGIDGRTSIFDYWHVSTINRWINKGKFNTSLLTKREKDLQTFYKKLLHICLNEKAIQKGLFYDLMWLNFDNPKFNTEKQYAFIRKEGKEMLLILVNFSDNDVDITVNIPKTVFDFFNIKDKQKKETINLINGKIENDIKDYSFSTEIKAKNGKILKIVF